MHLLEIHVIISHGCMYAFGAGCDDVRHGQRFEAVGTDFVAGVTASRRHCGSCLFSFVLIGCYFMLILYTVL